MHPEDTWKKLLVELVQEGEQRAKIHLSENQESYLVFALRRFAQKCNFLDEALALNYLISISKPSYEQSMLLADTADASLLIAGLYPERAKRLNVSSSYFMTLSKMSFFSLVDVCEKLKHKGEASLYKELGENVSNLVSVLYCTRRNAITTPFLLEENNYTTLH
ncbi:MAG: hypothetical protein RLZZ308_300 [Candidatus Parcubacteria bacterium]|jgi:hypothetical protein